MPGLLRLIALQQSIGTVQEINLQQYVYGVHACVICDWVVAQRSWSHGVHIHSPFCIDKPVIWLYGNSVQSKHYWLIQILHAFLNTNEPGRICGAHSAAHSAPHALLIHSDTMASSVFAWSCVDGSRELFHLLKMIN